MVRHARQVDVVAITIDKLVDSSPNPNDLIDFCYVTNINITLKVVNQVTTKRCQSRRPTSISNNNQRFGIKVASGRLVHLISTTKQSNLI